MTKSENDTNSDEDIHVRAAINAANIAASFLKSQMSGFHALNMTHTPPLKVDWNIFYQFAAGVYDSASQKSERSHGYDQATSIAVLPAFTDMDQEAAKKVVDAMSRPSHHMNRGGMEFARWLNGDEFDRFALGRSLGACEPPLARRVPWGRRFWRAGSKGSP